MSSAEIKRIFLAYFKNNDHLEIPNSSLVPEHDPTLLFVNSGMAPLKNYFTGTAQPPGSRLTNIQRCLRTEDLDEVGYNSRTLTFFEMMGSWSIGGYGKTEAAHFAFNLLTSGFGLDQNRLFATVFGGEGDLPVDTEAIEAWVHAGMQEDHIIKLPAKDNFWYSGPTGPCGSCTEVLYDRGVEFSSIKESAPGTDSERFLEIWNAGVFMSFNRMEDGSLTKLPIFSVDTGAGVERFACILQQKFSVFQTDCFAPLMQTIEKISGVSFANGADTTPSIKILADHCRAITFALADGVTPSNNDRGYVVRRLLRRACMAGKKININGYFLEQLAKCVIEQYAPDYPKLLEQQPNIEAIIREEEMRFDKALRAGKKLFSKSIPSGSKILPGKEAFKLYDSFGLPLSEIKMLAESYNIEIDESGFNIEMQEQQKRSREAGLAKKQAMANLQAEVAKNHTAAHLINEALRKIVDPQIVQAGQDLTAERVRFDFTFHRALTPKEIIKVEDEVKSVIEKDLPVTAVDTTYEEAVKQGAQALFADKYKAVDKVTLYSIGDYSKELCGGPHVSSTGEISSFKILKQEAVGRGVRRIRAVAS